MSAARLRLALDALTALIVASVAVALAALTWRLTGLDEGRTQVAIATPPASASAADLTPVLALAPFGSAAPAVGPAGDGSALGLVLQGVVWASNPGASSAMIAAAGAAPVAYRVGETVTGGAVLYAVEREAVVLQLGDRLERLTFPQPAGVAAPTPPSSIPAPVAAAPVVTPSSPPAPTSLASAGLTVEAQGLRVGADASPQLRATGLQPGDVVDRINGQPATAVAADPAALQGALAGGVAQVEVVRDGRRLSLTLSLR